MIENKIVHAENEVEYYLNLPHLITGALTSFNNTVKVLENNKIVNKEIVYNQTLTKQIDEAIQNSIDEFTRTDGKYANKISLKIDKDNGIITISDNGRGLPIDTYVMATTKFRTSSNYTFLEKEKKDRITIGAHGIGSKLIPLFSSEYQLTTITLEGDRGIVKCLNNMSIIEHKEDKAPASSTHGVIIKFKPDFERLELKEINDDLINHIHALLINIAYSNPGIEFTFQGKLIKVKEFKEFIKYYSDSFSILQSDENLELAIFPTDEYKFVHIVNSLDLNKGGVALDYISNNIVNAFGNRLRKGYSKITNTAVKSRIGVILILKNKKNLRFGGGQTKEEIKNTITELGIPTLKYTDFAELLFKNTHIKDPIIELYKVQQELENRKQNTFERKEAKERFNPKFTKHTKDPKFMYIAEGDSALSSLIQAVGRDCSSFLPLTGKLQNALKCSTAQLLKNQRVMDIVEAMGLGLPETKYENIVIATDADLDGNHIACLITALVYKLQPNLLTEGRVYRLKTPIISVLQNDKLIRWYYTLGEYQADAENLPKNAEVIYMKGLGSWSAANYNIVFAKDGIDNCLEKIEWKDNDEKVLEQWMSDNGIDFRKQTLSTKSFNIENL